MPPLRSTRIGLTARVVAAFAAFAVVVGVVLGLLLSSLDTLRDVNQQAQRSERAITLAFAAEKSVVDMETGLRGFLVSGGDEFLDPWRSGRREAPAQLRALRNAAPQAGQPVLVDRIIALVDAFVDDFGVPLEQSARDGLSRREVLAANREDKRRVDEIRALFQRFVEVEGVHVASLTDRAERETDRAGVARVLGAIVLFGLIVGFAVLVARRTTGPLRRIASGAQALAAGDLRTRVPENGAGEVGEVGRAFNAMAGSLQRTDAELRRLSDEHLALVEGVFAQTPVGLAFLGLDLRFARVNDRLGVLDGTPPEAHIGRPIDEILPPDIAAPVVAQLERVRAEGEPVTGAHAVTVPGTDATRWFDITCYPVRAPDGGVVGYGGVIVETTSTRQEASEREELLRRARGAARRIEQLQAATATLAAAITPQDVLGAGIAQAVAAVRAEAGAIALVARDGTLRVEAAQGFPADVVDHWRHLDASDHVPLVDAARFGRSVYLGSREAVHAAYPDVAERPSPFGGQTAIPLVAHGRTVGAMLIAFGGERTLPTSDRALLQAIAEQCAVALDRARLFARERDIASTLQQSLLPPSLPRIPGFTLRSRYLPTGEGYDVGGDFYDVVDLGDGSCLLEIGDVCGKGAEAAAVTGMARHTLRAEAVHDHRPSALLTRLNEALLADATDRFCTVAVGHAVPTADGAELTYALAGHHPALLVPAAGPPSIMAGRGGPVIGIFPDVVAPSHVAQLQRGDTVIFHTDGLLDAHAPERQLDQEELLAPLADGPRDVDALLERLIAFALGGGGEPRDDIALLAVRVE